MKKTQEQVVKEVSEFAAALILTRGVTRVDVSVVAFALLYAARTLWVGMGGLKLAAEQFYSAADSCVAEMHGEGNAK